MFSSAHACAFAGQFCEGGNHEGSQSGPHLLRQMAGWIWCLEVRARFAAGASAAPAQPAGGLNVMFDSISGSSPLTRWNRTLRTATCSWWPSWTRPCVAAPFRIVSEKNLSSSVLLFNWPHWPGEACARTDIKWWHVVCLRSVQWSRWPFHWWQASSSAEELCTSLFSRSGPEPGRLVLCVSVLSVFWRLPLFIMMCKTWCHHLLWPWQKWEHCGAHWSKDLKDASFHSLELKYVL